MRSSGERGEGWFTSLYAAHYPDIVRYGVRRTADLDGSVELAQEVFVVAWRRRVDIPENELSWLYGVARRLLANTWRNRRAGPLVTSIEECVQLAGTSPHSEAAAEMLDLRRALGSLNEADQEVLRLIGWERLTVGEAAVVLGCGSVAARVRLHRARQRLKAAMDQPRVERVSPTDQNNVLERSSSERRAGNSGEARSR